MKAAAFLILVNISLSSAKSIKDDFFELPAINSIIKSQLAPGSSKIDLLFSKTNDIQLKKNIHRSLFERNDLVSLKLKSLDITIIELEFSTVLIFNSLQEFNKTYPKIIWKPSKWRSYRHLVYVNNTTVQDLVDCDLTGWDIDNVAFLVDKTEKSISLVTSFMFTEKKCRDTQLVTINCFNKNTMKWANNNFYPRKYRNLHKCPVSVGKTDQHQSSSFDEVIREMSKVLNFKVESILCKTIDDLVELLRNRSCDFLRLPVNPYFFQPIVLSFESGAFVVPPGSSLDKTEKLLWPFDAETWTWIVYTFTSSLVIIQIICLLSKRSKELCFGQSIHSPTMNLLSIFFCGSQTRVPGNSWARTIFLTFVVWSLIIRTCFQSLSYRALQMDLRHPPMKTLEDLQRSGFHQLAPILNKDRSPNSSYG